MSSARITLIDGDPDKQDFELSSSKKFLPGAELEILAGYHGDNATIFNGVIIKHGLKVGKGCPHRLVIDLKDATVKMTVGRKNKYFFDKTDSDIFTTILSNDYKKLEYYIQTTTVKHPEMVQHYCTDWDFIVTRAEKNGQVVIVNNGNIDIVKPDTTTEPILQVQYGSSIWEFEVEEDARDQYAEVKASSWDIGTQAIQGTPGVDPKLELNGDFKVKQLSDVIGLSSYEMRHSGKVVDAERQAWADAKLMRSQLAKSRGRVRFQGIALAGPEKKDELLPGTRIELKGVGKYFQGKVWVSGVRHEITKNNWFTDVQFGLSQNWFIKAKDVMDEPAAGLLPGIRGLQIGVVLKLEEGPGDGSLVQVKIPIINENEGIWARVATLDAGNKRGSFFRPEEGDEVLIGFVNDDPRDAIIMGMLHNEKLPAPLVNTKDNNEKGFFTRSGMKIVFNDDIVSTTIETPGERMFILDDKDGSITLKD